MRRIPILVIAVAITLVAASTAAQERLGSGAPTPSYRSGWTVTKRRSESGRPQARAQKKTAKIAKIAGIAKIENQNLTTDNTEGTDQKTPKSKLYTDLPSLRAKN